MVKQWVKSALWQMCWENVFFPGLLSYQKEMSSLPYEWLLNTRCLSVLYYFLFDLR